MSSPLRPRQKVRPNQSYAIQVKSANGLYYYLMIESGRGAQLKLSGRVDSNNLQSLKGLTNTSMWFRGLENQDVGLLLVLSRSPVESLQKLDHTEWIAPDSWQKLQSSLLQRGRPTLPGLTQKPSSVAANMRSLEKDYTRSYTGKAQMLAVQYKLHVQKP